MIYFDNASTTKTDAEVREIMLEALENSWANPSSLHKLGFELEKKVKKARLTISNKLGVSAENLYFTPSATIANNAVFNSCLRGKKGNIVISEIEHASIAKQAFDCIEVRRVRVDGHGFIDFEDFKSKIDSDTILVSIMNVNNELGTVNKISELAKIAKSINNKVLFHSDGVQAFKKVNIDLKDVDFYTIASHKINGPKGIAGLFIRKPENFYPLYFGGGQEKNIFSSTENVPAILGFAKASELDNNFDEIGKINAYLRREIGAIEDSLINSPEDASPYILNVCFKNIGAEILLHYLEMDDIYISTGSACSKNQKSSVLNAIGLGEDYSGGCIRISMDRNSSFEEGEKFMEKLREKIEIIRGILNR